MYSFLYYIIIIILLIKCVLKLIYRPCTSKACLVGKTALITGGNKGIGYETSLGLAARGCKVIIGCRSDAEQIKEEIIKITHNPNIIIKHLDLSSLASVRKFCKEIHETEEKIDILINNAGVGVDLNVYTEDGLHPTMQTNLFGPFLMTHLLLDLLKNAGSARIIFVSSLMAFVNNLTLTNLNGYKDKPMYFLRYVQIYGNTKVGQIIISNEFAEKLKPFGITSNSLHPGLVHTGIWGRVSELNLLSTIWKVMWYIPIYVFSKHDSPRSRLQLSGCAGAGSGSSRWIHHRYLFVEVLRVRYLWSLSWPRENGREDCHHHGGDWRNRQGNCPGNRQEGRKGYNSVQKRGQRKSDEIVESTKNENVVVKKLNLSSQKSIREFAEDINKTEPRLDVLIHNAGTAEGKFQKTEDGLELTMATNHFGPYLLTHLLIDLLKRSAPARIVVVASELYRLASLNLNNINPSSSWFAAYLYYVSKYANICFTLELARRLEGTKVTANCLHPGMIDSGIWRNVPFPLNLPLKLIIKGFFKTPVQGCQTSVFLACSEEVEGVTGKYYMDCAEKGLSRGAMEESKAKKLWELSENFANLRPTDPKI